MKIETKTYKCITLSLSELGMLKAVEIERQKECDKHASCNDCGCRIDSRTLRYDEERHKYLRLSVLKDAVNKWNSRVDDEPYKKLFDLMVLYLALRDGVCSPIQTDTDNKSNVGSSGCTKISPPNKLTDMLNVYMTGGCKE